MGLGESGDRLGLGLALGLDVQIDPGIGGGDGDVAVSGQPRSYFMRYQGVPTSATRKVPSRKTRFSHLIGGLWAFSSATILSVK